MTKPRKKLVVAARYFGLAFQLFVVLVIAAVLGNWIDSLLELERPIFTALLIPLFLIGFIYKLYLDLNKDDDSK